MFSAQQRPVVTVSADIRDRRAGDRRRQLAAEQFLAMVAVMPSRRPTGIVHAETRRAPPPTAVAAVADLPH
jgi:hypothetical protein